MRTFAMTLAEMSVVGVMSAVCVKRVTLCPHNSWNNAATNIT